MLFDIKSGSVDLRNSIFEDMSTAHNSPVVYIENDATATEMAWFRATNSVFRNNTAEKTAGVVYAKNANVHTKENTLFEYNGAKNGDGGVFFLDCEDSVTFECEYIFEQTTFRHNYASRNGGVMQYNFFVPQIADSVFENNTAVYGTDKASYSSQFLFIYDENDQEVQTTQLTAAEVEELGLDPDTSIVYDLHTDFVSGNLMSRSLTL